MGINSLSLIRINKKVESINNILDVNERVQACRDLFVEVLKEGELYIIANPSTSKEEWDTDRVRPYIAQAGQGELYFMRVFSDKDLALRSARRIEAVLEDGTEMIIKVSTEQFVALIKDYFILGIDGVLLNDGENWITLNCEALLHAAFTDVLNIPDHYDVNFVNTVKAVYDIKNHRVRVVAPVKYYDGITEEDVFSGKAEIYPFGKEILFIEYYDKYKIESIFKEKVFWVDLSIDNLYSFIEIAKKAEIKNVKIAYRDKEGNGTPDNILGLLNAIGHGKKTK